MTNLHRESKSPLEKMAREAAVRIAALQALLEIHCCNSNPTLLVKQCVSGGHCRCSCELFLSHRERGTP